MSIDNLLSRVKGVKKTSAATWMCKCPSHQDRLPSLSLRLDEDGRVLIHCFGGCSPYDVLAAVGMTMEDLFPDGPLYHKARAIKGAKVFPRDVLKLIRTELMIVAISAHDLRRGKTLSDIDQARLSVAYDRITHGLELAEIE